MPPLLLLSLLSLSRCGGHCVVHHGARGFEVRRCSAAAYAVSGAAAIPLLAVTLDTPMKKLTKTRRRIWRFLTIPGRAVRGRLPGYRAGRGRHPLQWFDFVADPRYCPCGAGGAVACSRWIVTSSGQFVDGNPG